MNYELNKLYYWNNTGEKVKLVSIFQENQTLYGTVLSGNNSFKIVHLSSLSSKLKIRKSVSLTIQLTKDNDLAVFFRHLPGEEEDITKTNFVIEVDENEV
jgi:hypothetical protein